MSEERNPYQVMWDIWWTAHRGAPAILRAQQARLSSLVTYARSQSPFYRELYRDLPQGACDLQSLPVVTKPELMANLEDLFTDREIKRQDVEAFIADPELIGEHFRDRYAVWKTSGTSGVPGIFLHDPDALAVYNGLSLRGMPGWTYPNALAVLEKVLRAGVRTALILAMGGHYASNSEWQGAARRDPDLARRIRLFSMASPIADVVAGLNDFQPTIITTYAAMAVALAREHQAGRLRIQPIFILTTGETLDSVMRTEVERSFRCAVRNVYGMSECLSLAADCGRGWLHVNADWIILEPVDEDHRPVPPGTVSSTLLLTNLANRVQPIIRYEVGDSIMVSAARCPCGSPLPAIQVIGRTNEVLAFPAVGGGIRQVVPMVLEILIYETPGVYRHQIIQTAPSQLALRLQVRPGWNPSAVWNEARRRLEITLRDHGLLPVEIVWDQQPPTPDPVSGKLRRVWSELKNPIEHSGGASG